MGIQNNIRKEAEVLKRKAILFLPYFKRNDFYIYKNFERLALMGEAIHKYTLIDTDIHYGTRGALLDKWSYKKIMQITGFSKNNIMKIYSIFFLYKDMEFDKVVFDRIFEGRVFKKFCIKERDLNTFYLLSKLSIRGIIDLGNIEKEGEHSINPMTNNIDIKKIIEDKKLIKSKRHMLRDFRSYYVNEINRLEKELNRLEKELKHEH